MYFVVYVPRKVPEWKQSMESKKSPTSVPFQGSALYAQRMSFTALVRFFLIAVYRRVSLHPPISAFIPLSPSTNLSACFTLGLPSAIDDELQT